MPNILLPARMHSQFLHRHGLLVDLNCAWYCLNTALSIDHPVNGGIAPRQVPHPGHLKFAYDPSDSGLVSDEVKPATTAAWVRMLTDHGAVIVNGKLGLANWGHIGAHRLGVGHSILINGADTELDRQGNGRLFYLDPLRGRAQRHGTFDKLDPRIGETVYYIT